MGDAAERITLNTLIAKYHDLEDMLIESSGEITPEIEQEMDWLEAALADKLDGYADFIRYLQGQEKWLKDVADTYTQRARVVINSIQRMKDRILDALKTAREKKVKTAAHSFSHVERADYMIIHEEAIPAEMKESFLEQGIAEEIMKYDKRLMGKWLKDRYFDSEAKAWSEDMPKWVEPDFKEWALIR